MAVPDAWTEFARISIIREGAVTDYSFDGMTEDISFEYGDKDIEGKVTSAGGRIVRPISMTDESVTFKVYPTTAKLDDNGGVVQFFHPQATDDSTEPIVVDNSNERLKHKIVMLWAEGLPTAPADAITLPAAGKEAYRIQIINAYMTEYKINYDDKILNAEVTFKWTPFNKAAGANKREESTDGTVQLDAVTTTVDAF